MGLEWSYGAGLGLWGRRGSMGQAWSCPCSLQMWGAVGQRCGARPPDPHMWGTMGQSCLCSLQTHSCGALWVRAVHTASRPTDVGRCGSGLGLWGLNGAMGQAWGYGAGLELWVRTVGQSCPSALPTHTCGALWVRAVRAASRPTHVGRCGSEMWGAASRPTHVGHYGSELSVQPPDPQLWGAVGQSCAYSLQTH